MKKVVYMSSSLDQLSGLPDCQVIDASLDAIASPENDLIESNLVVLNQPDAEKAGQKQFESLMAALKIGGRPILLLNDSPMIALLERLEPVKSGLNGMVTRDTLRACLDTLISLEPVDPDYDWEIVLSLVQPLAHAACEVLETTANTETRIMGYLTGRVVPPGGELASCLTFDGEIQGMSVAVFSKDQARSLAAQIGCCSEAELTESDIIDGVQEIINQVSGRLRTLEWSDRLKFSIDLPHVFHLDQGAAPNSSQGWITILIECLGQICCVSLKASKAKN